MESDDVDRDLPSSSSSLASLPRRLKFRSLSEILSVTPQVIPRTVTIWRNGVTVDDNPLITLDDPKDAEFLRVNYLFFFCSVQVLCFFFSSLAWIDY